jgi:hypothetical protein
MNVQPNGYWAVFLVRLGGRDFIRWCGKGHANGLVSGVLREDHLSNKNPVIAIIWI